MSNNSKKSQPNNADSKGKTSGGDLSQKPFTSNLKKETGEKKTTQYTKNYGNNPIPVNGLKQQTKKDLGQNYKRTRIEESSMDAYKMQTQFPSKGLNKNNTSPFWKTTSQQSINSHEEKSSGSKNQDKMSDSSMIIVNQGQGQRKETVQRSINEDLKDFKDHIINSMKAEFKTLLYEQIYRIKETLPNKVDFSKLTEQIAELKKNQIRERTVCDRNNAYIYKIYSNLNKYELSKDLHLKVDDLNQIEQQSQTQQNEQSANNKANEKEQKLLMMMAKQNEKLRQQVTKLEQKLKCEQRTIISPKSIPHQKEVKSARSVFVSNIFNRHEGDLFLKERIEQFSGKPIAYTQFLFQKDRVRADLGKYIDSESYPYLILIESKRNAVFGIFGQGIYLYTNSRHQEYDQKFKAFLFNLETKAIFQNERSTKLRSVSYMDNLLKVGNSQLLLRNNSLDCVKVYFGKILGQCYINLKNSFSLTSQEQEEVQIKSLELHRIYFQKP